MREDIDVKKNEHKGCRGVLGLKKLGTNCLRCPLTFVLNIRKNMLFHKTFSDMSNSLHSTKKQIDFYFCFVVYGFAMHSLSIVHFNILFLRCSCIM